ncbi:MAG: hypothetical protein IKM97_02990 [Clostridia bacterium]|nr:hypothetical protein [Clostridia bacterium]
MNLKRISFIIMVAIIIVSSLTISTSAFSNEDLATYLTSPHMISGSQYKLTDANAVATKEYLMKNPVTDAQAAQIKGLLDQALSKVNERKTLKEITPAEKIQIISLLQQAGNVAGFTVTVDTSANTVTVSKSGTVIISGFYVDDGNGGVTIKYANNGESATRTAANGGSKTFVYTGANNSIFVIIALLAVVAVSTLYVKKAYAK